MRLFERQLDYCPPEFQERLTAAGGVNRYDEPNFRIVWGMTDTFRAIDWQGYCDRLIGSGEAAWILQQWNPPEFYGTPGMYYFQNRDEATGLQILGEYPYSGRYESLQTLTYREFVNGNLVVERMPLNNLLLDMIVPVIMECKGISMQKRASIMREQKERKDAEEIARCEDIIRDAHPAFHGGSVSYSRQGCRTSLVDRKIEQMQRHMQTAIKKVRSVGKGLHQLPLKETQYGC